LNSTADGAGALRLGLLLFFAVLALSLPQAVSLPLLDRDEPRFAEASREMKQGGDWIVPTFNGAPRYAKPPLIYWCQAAAFALLGENPLAARLPSLLATAATALLLFYRGTNLGGTRCGMIAALAFAFCFQTMQQGRVATADALLVFFMTLTIMSGGKLLGLILGFDIPTSAAEGSRRWIFWGGVLALAFAGGFLAKGPVAWLPLVPIMIGARKGGPRVLGAIAAIFALGLLIVSAWAIPAWIETHGDYWREGLGHDVGDRMVSGNFQGHGASTFGWYLLGLPFYLLTFWLSTLPWSLLLLSRWHRLLAGWKFDAIDTYVLLNAALIFVVFTLMVTKLPHYTLPGLPLLALIFARRWIAVGLPARLPINFSWTFGVVLALLAVGAGIVTVRTGESCSPVGRLVQQARPLLAPETKFALVDFQEPNAIWEMRRAVRADGATIPDNEVIAYLQEPGPRAVVLSTKLWNPLAASADPGWKIFHARGWNAAKLTGLDLTLVVKSNRTN
jgi:4-amino-4-deoxy-L-arabinose transferase-like glycosyltransferase